jgi:hypothetical protein
MSTPGNLTFVPSECRNVCHPTSLLIPALLRAIKLYDGRPLTRQAIKLMELAFVHTGELIGARWEEFDFEAGAGPFPPLK